LPIILGIIAAVYLGLNIKKLAYQNNKTEDLSPRKEDPCNQTA
jgi:hypothetical protein